MDYTPLFSTSFNIPQPFSKENQVFYDIAVLGDEFPEKRKYCSLVCDDDPVSFYDGDEYTIAYDVLTHGRKINIGGNLFAHREQPQENIPYDAYIICYSMDNRDSLSHVVEHYNKSIQTPGKPIVFLGLKENDEEAQVKAYDLAELINQTQALYGYFTLRRQEKAERLKAPLLYLFSAILEDKHISFEVDSS